MSKFTRIVCLAWAMPLTLFGLAYAALFAAVGWYSWVGTLGDALVWRVQLDRSPAWLVRVWRGWTGHGVGNVVVLNIDHLTPRGHTVLHHEQAHVRQAMRFGALFPLLYGLGYTLAWALPRSYALYDNPFEVDARRSAGQVIDVVSAVRWAFLTGKLK